jgi:hypothetical protein
LAIWVATVISLKFAVPRPSPDATGGLSLTFPVQPNSVQFAVIGDNGTGEEPQYQVAQQMVTYRAILPYSFVLMLGDNIYGGHSPEDFARKFEQPYKVLLDAGVKFYASLGNHDRPLEVFYEPFNMGGHRYYAFTRGNVRFLALDSNYMGPDQLSWLEQQLHGSTSAWKICFFHHPLYSTGKMHGSAVDLRKMIEPLFKRYGVNVVFSGHEHFYERMQPQNGIQYFIMGCAGQLRPHDIMPSPLEAAGFDKDRAFMLVEIAGDDFYFDTVSRIGKSIDSGHFTRQQSKAALARAPE